MYVQVVAHFKETMQHIRLCMLLTLEINARMHWRLDHIQVICFANEWRNPNQLLTCRYSNNIGINIDTRYS